jgi:hypothetical protein
VALVVRPRRHESALLADVGQGQREEVDLITAGANYGLARLRGNFVQHEHRRKLSVDDAANAADF